MTKYKVKPAGQRLWTRIRKTPRGCWEFQGAPRSDKGYINFSLGGKSVDAHRAAWILTHGPIPKGMMVCHVCDNPPCVRPDHLFLGTALTNNQDRERKGRGANRLGERNPRAKMTTETVREMRLLSEQGWTATALGERFGITPEGVRAICLRQVWKHVE